MFEIPSPVEGNELFLFIYFLMSVSKNILPERECLIFSIQPYCVIKNCIYIWIFFRQVVFRFSQKLFFLSPPPHFMLIFFCDVRAYLSVTIFRANIVELWSRLIGLTIRLLKYIYFMRYDCVVQQLRRIYYNSTRIEYYNKIWYIYIYNISSGFQTINSQ